MNNMHTTFRLAPDFTSSETIRKELLIALQKVHGSNENPAADDLCQVVSELVNNAVEHGKSSYLIGELAISKERVSFTLITDGVPFDPTIANAVMPDFDENYDLPEGGYGLAIIRKLSDEFHYRHENGRNMTTVTKFFGNN